MSLIGILSNQRGQSPFWGALLGGFNRGLQQVEDRKRQRQELELQKKQIDLRTKQFDLEEQMKQQQMEKVKQDVLRQSMLDKIAGEIEAPQQQQVQVAPGVQPEAGGYFGQELALPPVTRTETKPAGLRERLIGAQLRGAKVPGELFKQAQPQQDLESQLELLKKHGLIGGEQRGGGMQMVPSIGRGGISLRGTMPRQALDLGNAAGQEWLKANPGDFEGAAAAAARVRETVNRGGARGGQLGTLDVQTTPQFQQTQRQISEQKGLGTRAATARAEMPELENVREIVGTLDSLTQQINTAENAVAANAQGAMAYGGALSGGNPVARAYNDQRSAFTGVLSRSLGGEKGVLTDRDIARVVASLPGFTDTKAVRDFKIDTVKNLIETAIEAKRSVAEGRPFDPNVKKNIQAMVDQLEGKTSAGKPSPGRKLRFNPATGKIE